MYVDMLITDTISSETKKVKRSICMHQMAENKMGTQHRRKVICSSVKELKN
jgi:hypothetical protein